MSLKIKKLTGLSSRSVPNKKHFTSSQHQRGANMQLLEIHKKVIQSGLLLDAAKVELNKITPDNIYDQALKNFLVSYLTSLITDSLHISLVMQEGELLGDSESVCKLYGIKGKD